MEQKAPARGFRPPLRRCAKPAEPTPRASLSSRKPRLHPPSFTPSSSMAPYYPHPPTPSSPSTPRRRTSIPAHGGTTRTPKDALAPDTLSFAGGVALCCADIIGSGIFASPGVVLHWCGSGRRFARLRCDPRRRHPVRGRVRVSRAELTRLDPNAFGAACSTIFGPVSGPHSRLQLTFINFSSRGSRVAQRARAHVRALRRERDSRDGRRRVR